MYDYNEKLKACPKFLKTVESDKSLYNLEIGNLVAKCVNNAIDNPKFPSAFSKSMGFILWGMVEEPISPSTFFYLKYPSDIYIHMSLEKSIKIVFVNVNAKLISAITSCDSIYVVYGFHPMPSPSTKS